MAKTNLERWHDHMASHSSDMLRDMLHDDVVFHSPVVHTPQRGKDITFMYLASAGNVFGEGPFEYVREFDCGNRAVLEFTSELDGIQINGIDMIEWDENGLITDFKVMVRPLKAVNLLHMKMMAMLETMKAKA